MDKKADRTNRMGVFRYSGGSWTDVTVPVSYKVKKQDEITATTANLIHELNETLPI